MSEAKEVQDTMKEALKPLVSKAPKLTPGPLHVEVGDDGNSCNSLDIVSQDGCILVSVVNEDETSKEDWANAVLYSSAPELYAALEAANKLLLRVLNGVDLNVNQMGSIQRVVDANEAALKKGNYIVNSLGGMKMSEADRNCGQIRPRAS